MKNSSDVVIFSDGGSRGNPGPAACAIAVYKGNDLIFSDSKYLGIATNNVAEYEGVKLAIDWLIENKIKDNIIFNLDSQLVARQLSGIYKIKDSTLVKLALQIKTLQRKHNFRIVWNHIPREKNKVADALLNEKLDNSSRL